MSTRAPGDKGGFCKQCGAPLGSGPHRCMSEPDQVGGTADGGHATPAEPRARFRSLLSSAGTLPASELPDSLLEQVPEELRGALANSSTRETPRRPELSKDTAQSLRGRGYVLEEDAHGLRISGMSGSRAGKDRLSASDVVRMAAELEGGIKPPTNLQTCAKCQGRTPPDLPNCQWCGEPFG